jgi:peptidoglycan/LPS O-acetylase OafA/YrhL
MSESRRSFWIARFARIYPVYVLGLLAALPFVVYWTFFAESPSSDPAAFVETGLLQVTLLQAWLPWAASSWNGPGWSLSAEVFFYLLFPYLITLLARTTTSQLMVCALAAFALAQFVASHESWIFFFGGANPLFHLFEFVIGVVAGLLFVRHEAVIRRYALVLTWGSLAVCVIVVAFASPHIPVFLLSNAGLSLPAAALFLGLASGGEPLSRLLSGARLVRLGEASYAIYILHSPMGMWVSRLSRSLHPQIEHFPLMQFLVYYLVVVVISLYVFARIEEPMRRAIRERFANPRRATQAGDSWPRRSARVQSATAPTRANPDPQAPSPTPPPESRIPSSSA